MTIVGGGIAGLMLGIILRRVNTPVRVIESGHYPRHRVCGEFLSGEGLRALHNFNLAERLHQHGARSARSIRFYSNGRAAHSWNSPSPAMAVPRFTLDQLLADCFREAGGELLTGCRWSASYRAEGVVRAAGRRVDPAGEWRWIGLKAHAFLDAPAADLEMHFGRRGYAGVARLAGGKANVCALLRTRAPLPNLHRAWPALLEEMIGRKGVQWDTASFCSVAGFSFQPPAPGPGECSIGDAMAIIPPLTGNGMSVALESAALAASPLIAYARGGLAWEEAAAEVATRLDSHFRERLRWAAAVQNLVFTRPGKALLHLLVTRFERVLPLLFERTR